MIKLDERVAHAIKTDPKIISPREELGAAEGRSLAQMEALGLSKRDLKWLERKELAVRAYTANGYMHYFDDEQGRKMQQRKFGRGSTIKWILLVPRSQDNG